MSSREYKEIQVLEFLNKYIKAHHGFAPSYREIMESCGITSSSVVKFYLDHLEKDQLIGHMWGRARAIYITEAGYEQLRARVS